MASPTPSPAGSPSSDEKIMAAIAYLGPAIFWLPTIVIFLLKKDESRYIKFHCLQALGLGLLGIVIGFAIMFMSIFASFIPYLGILLNVGIMLVWFVFGMGFFVYCVYLIIKTFQGTEIEVPYLGSYIKQNLMG